MASEVAFILIISRRTEIMKKNTRYILINSTYFLNKNVTITNQMLEVKSSTNQTRTLRAQLKNSEIVGRREA